MNGDADRRLADTRTDPSGDQVRDVDPPPARVGDENLRVGLVANIKPVEDQTVRVWKAICAEQRTGKVLERELHRGVR